MQSGTSIRLDECKLRLGEARSALSSMGLMAAAIITGFSTFIPGLLVNFGISVTIGVRLFVILYLFSMPPLIAILYELYRFSEKVMALCNGPRPDLISFAVGLLPFGLIAVLYYVESLIASHCERLRNSIKLSAIDLFINIIVLGLHVIFFAKIFNHVVDEILPRLCAEE